MSDLEATLSIDGGKDYSGSVCTTTAGERAPTCRQCKGRFPGVEYVAVRTRTGWAPFCATCCDGLKLSDGATYRASYSDSKLIEGTRRAARLADADEMVHQTFTVDRMAESRRPRRARNDTVWIAPL